MEKVFFKPKQRTKAQEERGVGLLRSTRLVINLLYGLMIFQTFLILPRPEDPELEYLSLGQIFATHTDTLLVIIVGLILIIVYWIQFNNQLGNLIRSSPVHASMALVQAICLMLYMYFLRFDMEFDGMKLALQMQSILLAAAGFIGVINWKYAVDQRLTSENTSKLDERNLIYKMLPEPIAALFSLPFAAIGPNAWTIAFLVVFPLGVFFNWLGKKPLNSSSEDE